MAPSNKSSLATSASKRILNKGIVVFKLPPKALKSLQKLATATQTNSSKSSSIVECTTASSSSLGENNVAPSSHTPVQPETPGSSMKPPTEGSKKKTTKRTAAAVDGNSAQKIRGRPGPKKKARFDRDDGTIDHSTTTPRASNGTAVKLGPKANQGAINAGLRALDRSGKPCRKWAKGSFKIKSLTGITWEIPRWKASLHVVAIHPSGDAVSGECLHKTQKIDQVESALSEKSNAVFDVEMGSSNGNSTSSSNLPPIPSGEGLNTSTQSSPLAASS